jgi:hypothetical protein
LKTNIEFDCVQYSISLVQVNETDAGKKEETAVSVSLCKKVIFLFIKKLGKVEL